jgi:uncharacterized membrane protein
MRAHLTLAERRSLRRAIEAAELGHRGEIRVHLERRYPGDGPTGRAAALFAELGMNRTRDGTGVLLYVAEGDRKVAVFAGPGVYETREPAHWAAVCDAVAAGYRDGDRVGGLTRGLAMIGDVLRKVVPGEDDAGDELPNEVNLG